MRGLTPDVLLQHTYRYLPHTANQLTSAVRTRPVSRMQLPQPPASTRAGAHAACRRCPPPSTCRLPTLYPRAAVWGGQA